MRTHAHARMRRFAHLLRVHLQAVLEQLCALILAQVLPVSVCMCVKVCMSAHIFAPAVCNCARAGSYSAFKCRPHSDLSAAHMFGLALTLIVACHRSTHFLANQLPKACSNANSSYEARPCIQGMFKRLELP